MSPLTLDAQDDEVFQRGARELVAFNSSAPRLLVQNFGVAIAVLLHRLTPGAPASGPPRILARARTGASVPTGDLQTHICDPTWAKARSVLPAGATGPIYKPFTENFKGRSPAVNNWRNSFDLQAGLGCDAPSQMLADPTYLGQPRFDCRFRDPTTGECWSPAGNVDADVRTCFNPNKRATPPGPDTRAQHRPKLLARGMDADGKQGYWFVEPTIDVLVDLLADPGKRVPAHAFAAALYGGSPYFSQWSTEVSIERLQQDLVLGPAQFTAVFDTDPSTPFNSRVLRDLTVVTETPRPVPTPPPAPPSQDEQTSAQDEDAPPRSAAYSTAPLSDPVEYRDRPPTQIQQRAGHEADPARRRRLLERAQEGHRRTLGVLADHLIAEGYAVNEQLDGYDLFAQRDAGVGFLFEVKTWTAENLAAQVRGGWAQLHEYRYRNRDRLPEDTRLYLVLDREPPLDYWAWTYLAEEEDVLPCWIAGGRLTTLLQYQDRLPPGLTA